MASELPLEDEDLGSGLSYCLTVWSKSKRCSKLDMRSKGEFTNIFWRKGIFAYKPGFHRGGQHRGASAQWKRKEAQ